MKSTTELAREEIRNYLKNRGEGVRVSQSDLTNHLKNKMGDKITNGIISGLYFKMSGNGPIYIPIPNIKVEKGLDGKMYYYYKNNNIDKDSALLKLKEETSAFEKKLKNLNINIMDLTNEERQIYIGYIEQFKKLIELLK